MSESIQLRNICKIYRTEVVETTALQHLDLTVKKGEFIALMGPSGCGKTTLLNILGLIDVPNSGSYHLDGHNTGTLSSNDIVSLRRANIGFVFQHFNLLAELTVEENVELPMIYQGVSKTNRKETVSRLLEQLKIDHRGKHLPSLLSGGQQQRVAIARALANNPAVLLADEPTGNLDHDTSVEILNILSELKQSGATIVMVTHSQHDAGYADSIIEMLDGKIQK